MNERELRIAIVALELNLRSLFALAYADEHPLKVPEPADKAGDDAWYPVLAAIAASREAEAEMAVFCRSVEGRQMTDVEAVRENWLAAAQKARRDDVWATSPTTTGLEYAEFQAKLTYGDKWRDEARREPFGDAFPALAAAIEAQATLGLGADAAIAELADEFCRIYRVHDEADRAMLAETTTEAHWKVHHDAVVALAQKLAATKPTTTIGLALKCLGPLGLLAWQGSSADDPAQLEPQASGEGAA